MTGVLIIRENLDRHTGRTACEDRHSVESRIDLEASQAGPLLSLTDGKSGATEGRVN